MSRAFTKEVDDAPEPIIEIRVAGKAVPVTAAGRRTLEARLRASDDPLERKRLDQLVADLVIVEPPADRASVAFGATVDVHGPGIGVRRFTLVGEIEADVAAGRISSTSPLSTALLGARAGDTVTWRRPAGDVKLTVDGITYSGGP